MSRLTSVIRFGNEVVREFYRVLFVMAVGLTACLYSLLFEAPRITQEWLRAYDRRMNPPAE